MVTRDVNGRRFEDYNDEFVDASQDEQDDVNDLDDGLDDEDLDDDFPTYGTGVHDQPSFSVRGRTMRDRLETSNASPIVTGGDVDANWEQASVVGDESVGGTATTPDMDVVDELGAAVGLEMDDQAFLRTAEILEDRDSSRWELNPESSEDYDHRGE